MVCVQSKLNNLVDPFVRQCDWSIRASNERRIPKDACPSLACERVFEAMIIVRAR